MRTKLCLAVAALLFFGAVSAQALVCDWCDCTMSCSKACRDSTTWGPSTCGASGPICAEHPDCLYFAEKEAGSSDLFSSGQALVCSAENPSFESAATD